MEIGRRIGGGKTLPPSLFSLDGLPLWAERFFWLGVLDLGQGGGGKGSCAWERGRDPGRADLSTCVSGCVCVCHCHSALQTDM